MSFKPKVKAEGVITVNPKDSAPSFVLGKICITLDSFNEWLEGEGKQYVTEFQGKRQIKLDVVSQKDRRGILVSVDTYKPE